MQSGMELRGRRLPGAVPVVRPRPDLNQRPNGAPQLGFLGSVRKHLSDLVSRISFNATSYDFVDMEETVPLDSTVLTNHENQVSTPLAAESGVQHTDGESGTAWLAGSLPVTPAQVAQPRTGSMPQQSQGLTGSLPVAPPAEAPVVNNYSNCSFMEQSGHAVPTHRYPKLPMYDDSQLDFEAYLANFNAITAGWSDDDKLRPMREKLQGASAKVLAALDLKGTVVTFQGLINAIHEHYIGERSDWAAKSRDMHREEGESLDDLAFRLQLYSKRAYGKFQTDLGLQFYLALRDTTLGDKLYQYKNASLEEVLRQAKAYESHLLATNKSACGNVSVAAIQNQHLGNLNNDKNRGRGCGRGSGSRGRGNRYGNNDRRFGPNCFICNELGHYWRKCPRAEDYFRSKILPSENGNAENALNN